MMMHDCIEGMAEPLYGFVTKVNLVEDQACSFNVTCDANGNLLQSEPRQNNVVVDRNPNQSYIQNHNDLLQTYLDVNRQATEEFTASGPPRCRVRRDPSNSCQNRF